MSVDDLPDFLTIEEAARVLRKNARIAVFGTRFVLTPISTFGNPTAPLLARHMRASS